MLDCQWQAHQAQVVGADVGVTDVIAKGDKDIGFLNLRRVGEQSLPQDCDECYKSKNFALR